MIAAAFVCWFVYFLMVLLDKASKYRISDSATFCIVGVLSFFGAVVLSLIPIVSWLWKVAP